MRAAGPRNRLPTRRHSENEIRCVDERRVHAGQQDRRSREIQLRTRARRRDGDVSKARYDAGRVDADLVRAVSVIDHGIGAVIGMEDERIRAGASVKDVVSLAAGQIVVASAAGNHVVEGAAMDLIRARTARDGPESTASVIHLCV